MIRLMLSAFQSIMAVQLMSKSQTVSPSENLLKDALAQPTIKWVHCILLFVRPSVLCRTLSREQKSVAAENCV